AGHLGISELVRFLPPVPAEELAELYRAADVTVVPSYNESFGLVALESQACGTPVVAAAVGGLPTAVAADVSGLLVEGHRPADYAAVLELLRRQPAYRELLGNRGRGHAERFSWQVTAERLLDTYRDAMADPIFHPADPAALR